MPWWVGLSVIFEVYLASTLITGELKEGKIKGFFSQEKTKIQRETLLEDKKCVERVL